MKSRKTTLSVVLSLAALVVVAVLASLALSRPPETIGQHPLADPVTVRFPIPIVESGQTPFYVAEDQGYYGNNDIEPEFSMGSKDLNPVKMVVAGKDMFGVLGGPDSRRPGPGR